MMDWLPQIIGGVLGVLISYELFFRFPKPPLG